jgi:hypothetical protein
VFGRSPSSKLLTRREEERSASMWDHFVVHEGTLVVQLEVKHPNHNHLAPCTMCVRLLVYKIEK